MSTLSLSNPTRNADVLYPLVLSQASGKVHRIGLSAQAFGAQTIWFWGTSRWFGRLALRIALIVCVASYSAARAEQRSEISFQGVLNQSNGARLATGIYNLTFRFYASPTTNGTVNGNAVITTNGVAVTDGLVNTAIPVQPDWFDGQTRWLGISVGGAAELLPRMMVTAVPYALMSRSLESDGISIKAGSTAVGIGTSDPSTQLHIAGDASDRPPFRLDQSGDDVDYGLMITEPGAPSSARIFMEARALTVMSGDGTTPAFRVRQRGEGFDAGIQLDSPNSQHSGRIYMENGRLLLGQSTVGSGVVIYSQGVVEVHVLRIVGGADLAEHLSVTDNNLRDDVKIEPGMLVSIDPTGNRKLKLSDEPYDRRRVAIISGGNGVKPGLVLRDEGNPQADGEQPIALTGQVWCHADATFGPITPGDLVTTSGTPRPRHESIRRRQGPLRRPRPSPDRAERGPWLGASAGGEAMNK